MERRLSGSRCRRRSCARIELWGAVFACALLAGVLTSTSKALSAVTLPVVRCPTVYGAIGTKPRPVPRNLIARLAPTLASEVAVYSNGWVKLLGPRGWHCSGLVAADGGLGLTVLPPYVSTVTSTAAAITGGIDFNGPAASDGCPFFPELAQFFPRSSRSALCPGLPAGEQVSRLGARSVAFEDPPRVRGNGYPSGGAYPANGIVSYRWLRATGASTPEVAKETCTLPQAQHRLCTAILNDFFHRDHL